MEPSNPVGPKKRAVEGVAISSLQTEGAVETTEDRVPKLPWHLLWRVWALLPLNSLLTVCCVSKTWREEVKERKFRQLRTQIQMSTMVDECFEQFQLPGPFCGSKLISVGGFDSIQVEPPFQYFLLEKNGEYYVLDVLDLTIKPLMDIIDNVPLHEMFIGSDVLGLPEPFCHMLAQKSKN